MYHFTHLHPNWLREKLCVFLKNLFIGLQYTQRQGHPPYVQPVRLQEKNFAIWRTSRVICNRMSCHTPSVWVVLHSLITGQAGSTIMFTHANLLLLPAFVTVGPLPFSIPCQQTTSGGKWTPRGTSFNLQCYVLRHLTLSPKQWRLCYIHVCSVEIQCSLNQRPLVVYIQHKTTVFSGEMIFHIAIVKMCA